MVRICRLCLKSPKDKPWKFYGIFHLDDCGATPYGYIHDVIPEMHLSVSERPVLCQQCYDQTKNFYYFKKICLVSDQLIKIYLRNKARSTLKERQFSQQFIMLEDVVNYWRTIYKKYKDTEVFPTEVDRDRLEALFGEAIESEEVAEVLQPIDCPKEKTLEKPFPGLIVNVDVSESEEKIILQEIRNEIILGSLDLSHLIDSLGNYILGHVVEPCDTQTPTFALLRKSIYLDEALHKSDEKLQSADSKKFSDLVILKDSCNAFEVVHMKEALPVKVLYKSKRELVKDLFLLPNGDVEIGSALKDKVRSEAETKGGSDSEEDTDSDSCFGISEKPPSPPVVSAPDPMPLIRVRPMAALQKGPCDELQNLNAGGHVSIQQIMSKPPLEAQQQATFVRTTKRLQYNKDQLNQAVEAVINGGSTVMEASVQYGIPRTTLQKSAKEAGYVRTSRRLPYNDDALNQAVEAVLNGSTFLEATTRYGVPGSTIQNHVRKARNKYLLAWNQDTGATIPSNSEVNEIPENITSDRTYLDGDTRCLAREDSGPWAEVYLTEEELLEITEDENPAQSTILAVDRDLVNSNDANVEPAPLDLKVDAVDRMILVSPRDHRRVQIEHREEILDNRRESLRSEDNLFNELGVEVPRVQQPTSPVKKTGKPRTKDSTIDTQSNIIDIRTPMCKTEKEIQRDRRKALVDSLSAGSELDAQSMLADVALLFTKFTSDGDYVNDHDYLRSPYMRCQMVEKNQFCVCMLCGQRQLGRNHVKHLKKHETKCQLCNEQFDDVFLMNLHAYSHCHYCDDCKTNVFYYSYESHLRTHITKWKRPKKRSKFLANKEAAVNTQTTAEQSLGEPNCVLKLLLDNGMTEDPKMDKIWNLVQSPASSTTESVSLTERDGSPLTISELLSSSEAPDNNPFVSKGGSELTTVNSDPGEVILLTEEEIEELCSKAKIKRNKTRPLKSVIDILADIERDKAADEELSKEVVDNSNVPLLKIPPDQDNTGNSEQDVSIANPKECDTTSKEPTDNKIVHNHNTRSKSKHGETPKDGCHDATKPKCCDSPLHVPKRRKSVFVAKLNDRIESSVKSSKEAPLSADLVPDDSTMPILSKAPLISESSTRKHRKSVFVAELNDGIESLVKSGEEAPFPADVVPDNLTMPKLSKSPLIFEPNARKRRKSTSMDGTKGPEKPEEEPSVGSLVNSRTKRRRKSLFVPDDKSIWISDNAKMIRSKTPSILENKSRARRKSVFVPGEEFAANSNEACSREGDTIMGNCNKSLLIPEVDKPKKSSLEEPPSGDSIEPKRSKTPTILKTESKARRKWAFRPKVTKIDEPLKVSSDLSSENIPWILPTRSRAPRKNMLIPEVDKSEEEPTGNTNEDSLKVGQTLMEICGKDVAMPELEPMESCLNQSPSKATPDDLTRPIPILEPKPRTRKKRLIPEVAEPKATSDEPLKVSYGDPMKPKHSETPSIILQTKSRTRKKSIFVPHVEESQTSPETTPILNTKSRQQEKGVFMGDSLGQTSNKKTKATPELLPASSSNVPSLDKELVVYLDRMPPEALRLGYMLEQLKQRSLQAMEAQKKKRSLWNNTVEDNHGESKDRPKSTTKTPETGEIGDTPLHPKKSSKSQGPVNLLGEEVGPSVTRKKHNQGKTKVAPVEKMKHLSVSLEAIERLSEETRIRASEKGKNEKHDVPHSEPPKQIVLEDSSTFYSQSSTSLTDDYEVALPENLTLMEVFRPGAEDLGFTEADDVDIEG